MMCNHCECGGTLYDQCCSACDPLQIYGYEVQMAPGEAWCKCCGHEVPEDDMHWRGEFCMICTRDCGWDEDEL